VDDGDFARVNTVAAAGESQEEIDYAYEDDISNISGNYVYYRLKMVEKIGGDVNVHIYDMQGRQIKSYQWAYSDNSIVRERIDVSYLDTGLYLVEVVSRNERKIMKLDILR